MNEKIDLRQILRGCPKGTELYSPLFGPVHFYKIEPNYGYPIIVTYGMDIKNCISFTSDGRYLSEYDNGECLLFPSKDQRDWSKWKCPKPKKPKFDPKTLKPFDKVLCKYKHVWVGRMVSHIDDEDMIFVTSGGFYNYCVPYNEDTKHLVGTSEEAPEYYKYWEA